MRASTSSDGKSDEVRSRLPMPLAPIVDTMSLNEIVWPGAIEYGFDGSPGDADAACGWNVIAPVSVAAPPLCICSDVRKNELTEPATEPTTGITNRAMAPRLRSAATLFAVWYVGSCV